MTGFGHRSCIYYYVRLDVGDVVSRVLPVLNRLLTVEGFSWEPKGKCQESIVYEGISLVTITTLALRLGLLYEIGDSTRRTGPSLLLSLLPFTFLSSSLDSGFVSHCVREGVSNTCSV